MVVQWPRCEYLDGPGQQQCGKACMDWDGTGLGVDWSGTGQVNLQ